MAFFKKKITSSDLLKNSDYQDNIYSSSNSFEQEKKEEYNKEVVSVSDWVITFLICYLPLVNILFLIIWALGSKNIKRSKTNFARASLLISLITLAFILLILESTYNIFSNYIYQYLLI